MRPKKRKRLERREERVADAAEKAFFAGKDRKARRKLKRSLKIGNKLRGTNFELAVGDKSLREAVRKSRK